MLQKQEEGMNSSRSEAARGGISVEHLLMIHMERTWKYKLFKLSEKLTGNKTQIRADQRRDFGQTLEQW